MTTHFNLRTRRADRRVVAAVLCLLIALVWGLSSADTRVSGEAARTAAVNHAPGATLPQTDGADLSVQPPTVGPLERLVRLRAARNACDGPCATPFGTRLGVSEGVEARSNCVSTCLRLDYSFVDPESGAIRVAKTSPDPQRLVYTGVTYQCVEYARRWWIRNLGLTFGDVPTAADIFALEQAERLADHALLPLGRSLNGSAQRPPMHGDLLVYAPDPSIAEWRFGHVAVVVEVNTEQGWIALAEENYDNRPWHEPTAYARRIRLFVVGGRYTLVDVQPDSTRNPDGGHIAGWVYALMTP